VFCSKEGWHNFVKDELEKVSDEKLSMKKLRNAEEEEEWMIVYENKQTKCLSITRVQQSETSYVKSQLTKKKKQQNDTRHGA